MKGDPEFIILRHTAWMSAKFEQSILGAIIRNPLSPSTDHVPSTPLQYNKYDLQEVTANDVVLANTGTVASEASGSIATTASFAVKGREEDKIHLQGKLVRVKRLQQVSEFWAALRSDPVVKSTVPSWISFFNTWPVCIVVGIMVCEDVELGLNSATLDHHQAALEVPVGAPAVATGVPNFLGKPSGPNLAVNNSREAASNFEAKFGSRQIFAVELREVTTEFLHTKKLRLKNSGPGKIDPSRVAGQEPNDYDDYDDDPNKQIDPEELICVELDFEDLTDMAR